MGGTKRKNEKTIAKEKSVMGRPPKKISKRQFEELVNIQCTREEICNVIGVTDKTLNTFCKETYGDTFSSIFKQKSQKGKASLRRMQYKNAESGNATMQIWLGKQYLGQEDVSRQKIEAEVTANIKAELEQKIRAEVEQELRVTGELNMNNKVSMDLSALSPEELNKLLEIKGKIKEVKADEPTE